MSKTVEILQFLKELRANNNRPWFNERKALFVELREAWLADIDRLIAMIESFDPSVGGISANDCVYRIYRDTRFREDKTPYKTNFSAAIGVGGRKCERACYFLHIEPGKSLIGGGIWRPDTDILNRMRSLIDADGAELKSIIESPSFIAKFTLEGESLKRVPKGYPADHPFADLLRMKELLFVNHVSDDFFKCGDWVENVANQFKSLRPANDFINFVFE